MQNRFRKPGWENITYVVQQHKTDVIFRRSLDGKKVIAIFPEISDAAFGADYCLSCVDDNFALTTIDIFKDTFPISKDELEVEFFIRDLESIGYNLNVVSLFTEKHAKARKKLLT